MVDSKKVRGASGLEVLMESKDEWNTSGRELNRQELVARQGKQRSYVWELLN